MLCCGRRVVSRLKVSWRPSASPVSLVLRRHLCSGLLPSSPQLTSSPDGRNWQPRTASPSPNAPTNHRLQSVSPTDATNSLSPSDLQSIDAIASLLLSTSRPFAAITGAGLSTESGIPDYRSPGRPPYTPLQHADFLSDGFVRQRYWARSFVGYRRMQLAAPNTGHSAISELQSYGLVGHILTQNVDRLHQAAGATRVVELHGTIHEVECLECYARMSRSKVQHLMARENAGWLQEYLASSRSRTLVRPDGDVDVDTETIKRFQEPQCPVCDASTPSLKPAVVFHGGPMQDKVRAKSLDAVAESGGVLACGTSLTVYSAYRLVAAAKTAGKPVVIVNVGETRGDGDADVKVEAGVGQVLQEVCRAVSGRR